MTSRTTLPLFSRFQLAGRACAFRRAAALASAIALPALMSACATWPPTDGVGVAGQASECHAGASATENTRLSTIQQMLGEGKFYAALAQLDALGVDTPRARLIRADALRRIDRHAEAQAIYAALQGSCMDGQAQHGLGLIAAKMGRQAESLRYLQKARQALPTDTRVRNDLGYALLLAGQPDAARFEFLTVLDLNPQDTKASRNLVLLTFQQGQPAKAFELAARLGLDTPTAERLQQQALRPNPAAMLDPQPTQMEAR